jgi:hypothetical protein
VGTMPHAHMYITAGGKPEQAKRHNRSDRSDRSVSSAESIKAVKAAGYLATCAAAIRERDRWPRQALECLLLPAKEGPIDVVAQFARCLGVVH